MKLKLSIPRLDGIALAKVCALVLAAVVVSRRLFVPPNVGFKLTAEADGAWPRKGKYHWPLERLGAGCRTGSA